MGLFQHDGQSFRVEAHAVLNEDGETFEYIAFCTGPIRFGQAPQVGQVETSTYGFIPGPRFKTEKEAIKFAIDFVKMNWNDSKAHRRLTNGDTVVRLDDQRIGKVVPPNKSAVSMGHVFVEFSPGEVEEVETKRLIRLP